MAIRLLDIRILLANLQPRDTLTSSKQLFLRKPPVRTEIARRAFSQAAPAIWNDLPLDSRSAATY